MNAVSPVAARLLATGFGVLMVAAALAGMSGRPVIGVAVAAMVAVPVAAVFRPAATLAVLLTVAIIGWQGTAPLPTAICGLCAVAFLVLSYTTAVTAATAIAATGFTFVGLVATAFPLQLPWLPLVAPPAVFAGYLLAVRPFLG